MPVKIRLQRHGKKGKPFYWIVAADARSKRDGRYLEKLGTYNPNTNPATVEVKIDNAIDWLEKGAQPTDTARTLLSYKGVLLKHHLNGGIRKGALTEEQAEKKFNAWLEEKEAKIQSKKEGISKQKQEAKAERLANEKAVSEKRLAQANAAEAEANEAAAAEVEEITEATTAETDETTEATTAETAANETNQEADTAEAPAEEAPVEPEATEEVETAAPEAEAEAETEATATEGEASEEKES